MNTIAVTYIERSRIPYTVHTNVEAVKNGSRFQFRTSDIISYIEKYDHILYDGKVCLVVDYWLSPEYIEVDVRIDDAKS